jgi:hypothetical protein
MSYAENMKVSAEEAGVNGNEETRHIGGKESNVWRRKAMKALSAKMWQLSAAWRREMP